MADIIEFAPRTTPPTKPERMDLIIDAQIYMNSDDQFEVMMEIGEDYTSEEVFEALVAVAIKFATDEGLDQVTIDPEDL